MNIEITRPEVEALIQQRLRAGRFANPEDLIFHALRASEAVKPTGAELIVAIQSSPYREIEIEPKRERMPVRDAAI